MHIGVFMITLQFREGDAPTKFEAVLKQEMQKHIDFFDKELKKVRTGRAHASLVEDISIESYGTFMRLRDIATIATPDAQSLTVQPWDQSILNTIENALTEANLGVSIQNDGGMLRLRLPPMTAEQRENLVKTVHKKLEECKIALRNVRKDFNNWIRDLEKAKTVSEDTAKRLQNSLQKITDQYIEQSDALSAKKEKEIRSI